MHDSVCWWLNFYGCCSIGEVDSLYGLWSEGGEVFRVLGFCQQKFLDHEEEKRTGLGAAVRRSVWKVAAGYVSVNRISFDVPLQSSETYAY